MKTKTCKGRCGRDLPIEDFELRTDTGKRRSKCGRCIWQDRADREASAKTRLASDHEPLRADDFGANVANVPDRGAADKAERKQASTEKRQEFNRKMAQVHADVHDVAEGGREDLSGETIDYLATLSEAERRFGNRRIARSTAISLAHEMLGIRMFCKAADTYLSGKIQPTGYAKRSRPAPAPGELDRTLSIVLSDLHLGARLSELEHPTPFRRQEESRRLAHVVDQTLSYKPQYRARTRLKVLLNGDVIQGMLLHDLRDGAPLTEQMVIFWDLLSQAIARFSADFPLVEVHCQPGNHGRDKLRHEGRATSSKWDGHEWRMYYALSKMASGLPNVTFDIPFRAVSLIDYYGQTVAMTHGDTEVPLGSPSTQHDRNLAQLQKIAATRSLHCEPTAWIIGHFHSGCIMPGSPTVIYNGMLVPPDGHARTSGYVDKPCGQWLVESVRGHVVGDMRYVRVGIEQDSDASLDEVLRPSAFPVMQ
jgi:hypothetical protein